MDNNSFEFITINELKEILDFGSLELLQQKKYEAMSPLQQIKVLCGIFNTEIAKTSLDNNALENIYIFGAKLVYSIRQYLLQESIYFSIGATSPDSTKLSVKQLSQNEIFNNISANLKSKEILLSSLLEKFDPKFEQAGTSQMWAQILKATEFDWDKGYSAQRNYITSKNKTRRVYKKPEIDTNVWVRYYTRQKKRYLTYYYDKGNFDLIAYNQGWLYEWFQEYISVPENYQELQQAFATGTKTPLKNMMSDAQRENIAGYKGGDYINAQGKQMQAKLGNRRIITFSAIKKVLYEIETIVTQYEGLINNPANAKQMANKFAQLFTDQRTLNQGYDKIVDNILNSLKIKT